MGKFAETAIIDYHLLIVDQENKLPFSVPICSKPEEICCFRFPFATNKRKLPISVSSVFHLETWSQRQGNMENGDMETRTWRHGIGDMDIENGNGSPGKFPLIPLTFAQSSCKRKFVVSWFVDGDTYGNYLFANGLNGLAHLC
jgi:hypothetical protein